MPRYQIVPATQEHVTAMLPHVRQADRDEVLASSGLPMDQVLGKCVSLSEMAWAGLVDDQGAEPLREHGQVLAVIGKARRARAAAVQHDDRVAAGAGFLVVQVHG